MSGFLSFMGDFTTVNEMREAQGPSHPTMSSSLG